MSYIKISIFGILLVVVLAIGYYLASPLWIVNKVHEPLPVARLHTTEPVIATAQTLTGMFTGFDAAHMGAGTAEILNIDGKTYIRFHEDFTVTNGPDLYVGLGRDGQYIQGSEIARLKGNVGSQNYELVGDFDLSKYNEVWIWCKIFGVPFAKAHLALTDSK